MKGEEALLAAIAKLAARPGPVLKISVGDDAALLRLPPSEDPVLSQDALVEDRDFRAGWGRPEDIGAKACAAALSDLAAMGARPRASFLTLVLPRRWSGARALALVRGFAARGRALGAPLAGGDLSSGSGALVLDAVVLGSAVRGRALRRSTARSGDFVAVTGRLGGARDALEALEAGRASSAQRRRFFHPEPRLNLAWNLARGGAVTAAMDVSDGLALDLRRLCRASGLGAWIDGARVPLHPGIFSPGSPLRRDPLNYALGSGEEYELLLTVRPGRLKAAARACAGEGLPLTVIGRMTAKRGALVLHKGGRDVPLPALGFQHGI